VSQAHPPYPLDGFCLQWRSSVTYRTTGPVRYYPSMALVLLWSSVPCQHRSRPLPSSPGLHSGSSQRLATKNWKTRPLPSSPGLHSGSSQRLATKNWKTEANLAENNWWSEPAQLRPGDGALWIDRHGVYSWMRLRPCDTLQRERERERERLILTVLLATILAISRVSINPTPSACQSLFIIFAPRYRCCLAATNKGRG